MLKKDFFIFKRELLQNAKEKYENGGKEKAAKYYQSNKDAIKEKGNRYKEMKKMQIYFYNTKISGQTLKFRDIVVNKKEFHASKQAIALNLVDINKIVISDKFKHKDEGSKYFIGYKDDNIVRQLCIILPQMCGYIRYFESGGKNMSFMIEDDRDLVKYNEIWNNESGGKNVSFIIEDDSVLVKYNEISNNESGGKNMSLIIEDDSVLVKYNEIWSNFKKTLNIRFHNIPAYDEKYIKAKLREFNGVVNTNFCRDEIPKEDVCHTCIACINIDFVLKIEKNSYHKFI